MQQRNAQRLLNMRRDLMHGVGGQQDSPGSGLFQFKGSVGQKSACGLPLTRLLPGGHLGKIYRGEQQRRGVQAAQPPGVKGIQQAVIFGTARPAHTAQHPQPFLMTHPLAFGARKTANTRLNTTTITR